MDGFNTPPFPWVFKKHRAGEDTGSLISPTPLQWNTTHAGLQMAFLLRPGHTQHQQRVENPQMPALASHPSSVWAPRSPTRASHRHREDKGIQRTPPKREEIGSPSMIHSLSSHCPVLITHALVSKCMRQGLNPVPPRWELLEHPAETTDLDVVPPSSNSWRFIQIPCFSILILSTSHYSGPSV